jgi:hypothetical protein
MKQQTRLSQAASSQPQEYIFQCMSPTLAAQAVSTPVGFREDASGRETKNLDIIEAQSE